MSSRNEYFWRNNFNPGGIQPMSEKPDWDVLRYKVGDTPRDWMEGDIRCLIRRASASWCAYVGLPSNHRLARYQYDHMPLRVHGGLTFSGRFREFPGWWFYGWDYAHYGDDFAFNYEEPIWSLRKPDRNLFAGLHEQRWNLEAVEAHVISAAKQLARTHCRRHLRRKRRISDRYYPRRLEVARKKLGAFARKS